MIRKATDFSKEIRKAMYDGAGEVMVEHLYDEKNELLAPTRLFGKLTLAPGCSIGFHKHEREEEVFVVLQGEGEANDNGTLKQVGCGDTILTGNGAGHAIRNTGNVDLVLLAVIVKYVQ